MGRSAESLTSAPLAEFGADEPSVGEGPLCVCYLDLGCPVCAQTWLELRELPLRLGFRHFPVASKHPRAPALHAAVEAAGMQTPGAFTALVDLIYADHGRQDDPHLWAHARTLGLELARFDSDRRSPALAERIAESFRAALRGGVPMSPAALLDGRIAAGREAILEASKTLG